MKQWISRPLIALLLALNLALIGLFAGYVALAQGPESGPSDRVENSQGKTGQLQQPTLEQLQTIQSNHLSVLYHFAGALNNTFSAVERATVVQCTNVDDTESTEIELQLFQYNATSVYTGTISVDPMDTATFESSSVDFYTADVIMGAGFVEQGYGRILTEHPNVICTVQTIDPNNIPPNWSINIPVYSAASQNTFIPAVLKNAAP